MNDVVNFAIEYCNPHRLLLLSKSGSHLHGTDTEDSDLDYKGVFLPDINFCLMNDSPRYINFSTGESNSKNTHGDIDIDLMSVQEWCKLLKKGDSNALGLLFSTLNSNMVLYVDKELMFDFIENFIYLYDYKNIKSLLGFSTSQINRYILKGQKYNSLKELYNYIECMDDDLIVDDINFSHLFSKVDQAGEFCDIVFDEDGRKFLSVFTKKYMTTIKIGEFKDKIKNELTKYGERTKKAATYDGHDWKAISHAVRCYHESIEMLSKGYVEYPLEIADFLRNIKKGLVNLEEIEYSIKEMKKQIRDLEDINKDRPSTYDKSIVFSSIIRLYSVYTYNT